VELSPATKHFTRNQAPIAFPSIEVGAGEVKKKKVANRQDENVSEKKF